MNRIRNVLLSTPLFMAGIAPAMGDELISLDLVRQTSGSLEARMPYEASTAVRVGDRLEVLSGEGYDFGLSVSKTTLSSLGNRIIHASTDGGGKAVLVVGENGELLGSITELGERHKISTDADGQRQILRESYSGQQKRIDDGGLVLSTEAPTVQILLDLKEEELSSLPFRVMKAEQSSDVIYPTYKTGTAKISVLMYYDHSMSNAFSTIDFITQVANDAYADSGAKIEIDIVGTKALDIDDDASHQDLKSAMQEGEAPFEEIESDRSFFAADLVYLLRDTEAPDGEDPCGIASLGVYKRNHWRGGFTGLVQWKPANGQETYCSDYSFGHEVGHSLGARHNRESYPDDDSAGAYSYSHGVSVDGVFRTVMGVQAEGIWTPRLGLFSSPNLGCNGYPCGKPASSADSADNVSTFHSTGHLIASNEGQFAFEAVSAFALRAEEYECTTSEDEDGYITGLAITNNSGYSVELVSTHYRRPDGTYAVYDHEPGERVAEAGSSTGSGFCRAIGEDPIFGTTFTRGFFRYRHPVSGQVVETDELEADLDFDGEYRRVRVASGQGGSVSGNPAKSVRVGSSQTFTFTPDNGYAVASIQSNCSGRKSGNSYTVDVGQDDCFVEATFNQVAVGETLRLSIETPADGQVYSGIGTFQGWAVAQEGIDRVDLYVDGAFFQSAPYGGARVDVGNVFPDVPNSR